MEQVKIIVYSFLIGIFLFFPLIGLAQSSQVVISDSFDDYELTSKDYSIYIDTTGKDSYQKITSADFQNHFSKPTDDYPYIKDTSAAYWLKLTLKDQSKKERKWVLEYLSIHAQDVRFYVPGKDGTYIEEVITGHSYPFYKRPYKVSNIVFDFPSNYDGKTFYVRLKSRHVVGFEFKIRTNTYFTKYAVNEYYFLGFYYGILFIMGVYNFLLFLTSGIRTYIYYVFYVLSCMLNSFTEDGIGFQFLWSNHPEWNYFINNHLWGIVLLFTFVLYSASFLELRKNHRNYYRFLIFITAAYYIVKAVEVIFPTFNSSNFYIIPFLSVYVIALLVYNQGYRSARYFILGFTFVLISIFILQLRNYNIVDHNIFTVYSFNYGIVLEVVVLSFALGDRIKMMKEEKEKAQRVLIEQLEQNHQLQEKVNKELEGKVNERTAQLKEKTIELSEANEKLKKLTDELNKFASKLDLDNWELNKKIVEETKARMFAKELSVDEFSKIFPSEFSCLKYLEGIKWGEGYKCKKCGNSKFAVKPKLLSRKCSKCNYIESVTSSTIFHGIKFPLNKAFYIAYITSAKSDKLTVDELADTLQLNRLTCWKFRKKVLEKEGEIKKKSNITKVENWEILLREN
jgi:hypothetical protein